MTSFVVNKCMPRRHEIIGRLERYDVAKDMDKILDRLAYKKFYSDMWNWAVYTRGNGDDEFAALYNKNGNKSEFLITGQNFAMPGTGKNLGTIAQYVFNENKFLRSIRFSDSPILTAMALYIVELGIFGLDYITKSGISQRANQIIHENPVTSAIVGVGGPMIVGVGVAGARICLNRYYGSKLSKEAESYKYGKEAELALKREFIFEQVKSGELNKDDFLKMLEEPKE